jgi:hypothetical protein
LIIPLEAEVLPLCLLIAKLGFGQAVFEASSEALGEGGDVQLWILGVSFEEVKSGVGRDGSGGVKDLLDEWRGGRDVVFDFFVDVNDLSFIVWDNQWWGGRRRGRGFV